MSKDVTTVGPAGDSTRFAASCALGKKLATKADRVRGRILSICTDGVVVSDIAKRSSRKIPFPITKRISLEAPDVILFPESDTNIKSLDAPLGIFDPVHGTVSYANDADGQWIWLSVRRAVRWLGGRAGRRLLR